jgi:hypothetical protein
MTRTEPVRVGRLRLRVRRDTEVDERFECAAAGDRLGARQAPPKRVAVLPFCPFVRDDGARHPILCQAS